MGGKTKQSQRTKNNVRPSSSGRSAELLQGALKLHTAGSVFPTAGGAVFPALAHSSEAILAPGLALAFKKLNKKDPITKAKALQELSELVSNSDIEDVVAALPSWTHFYRILSVDTDRKVREATQACHGLVVLRCGRRVAPQLKLLLPLWLQAQHDDHAPAMHRARASLQGTFPSGKLPEVLSFCRKEVVAHLQETLLGNRPAPRASDADAAEELSERLARSLSSALRGLQFFAARLPADQQPWLRAELAPLLQDNAFWKLATHEDKHVRAAWYGAWAQLAPGLDAAQGRRLLRALMAATSKETDAPAAQLWGCLAAVAHNHQDWHTWLDKRELLSKRFLQLLEAGGWGDARRLGDVALPLLARLPEDMLTDEFLTAFFDAVFAGLEKKAVLSSKSERQAWLTSVGEYVRWVSSRDAPSAAEQASRAHRLWLRAVTRPGGALGADLARHSAAAMAGLLRAWLERPSDAAERLARNFWQNIGAGAAARVAALSPDPEEVSRAVEADVQLLRALRAAGAEPRRARCLRFHGDAAPDPADAPADAASPAAWEPSTRAAYERGLLGTADVVCALYWEFAVERSMPGAVLPPLTVALEEFGGPRLFGALGGAGGPAALWPLVLRPWLSAAAPCRPAVHVTFLLLPHLSEPEQDQVFADFDTLPDEAAEWCLQLSLSHPYRELPAARRWARGRRVRALLRSLAQRLLQRPDASAGGLLATALAHDHRGETLVGPESVHAVVAGCAAALAEERHSSLEQRASAASQLASALAGDAAAAGDAYGDLLAALFRISLLVPRGDERLAPETWLEVRSAWRDALPALPPARRAALTHGALELLRGRVHECASELDAAGVEHAADLAARLAAGDAAATLQVTRDVAAAPPPAEEAARHVAEHALRCACLAGELSCPLREPAAGLDKLARGPLLAHARACLYRAAFLRALLRRGEDEGDDPPDTADADDPDPTDSVDASDKSSKDDADSKPAVDTTTDVENTSGPVVNIENNRLVGDPPVDSTEADGTLPAGGADDAEALLAQEAARVLHDLAVFATLHRGYAFWEHHGDIEATLRRLETLAEEICADAVSEGGARGVLAALEGRAASVGQHWAMALARWATALGAQRDDAPSQLDEQRLLDIVTGDGFFHSMQAEAQTADAPPEAALRARYLSMVRALAVAHAHEPAVLQHLAQHALPEQLGCGPEPLVDLYYKHNHVMLYDRDVSEASWASASVASAVAEYLRQWAPLMGWQAPAHHWDFATIALCSLVESVEKSTHAWGDTKVSLVSCSALRLLLSLQRWAGSVPAQCQQRQPLEHVASLPGEWRHVFAPSLQRGLYTCLLHVMADDGSMTASRAAVVVELSQCLGEGQWAFLEAPLKEGRLSLSSIVRSACACLERASPHALKFLAYHAIDALAEPLVLEDAAALSSWSESATDDEAERPPPMFALNYYAPTLQRLLDLVGELLKDVRVCEETLEPAPYSVEHSVSLGCLLVGCALLGSSHLRRDELQQHYVGALSGLALAEPLLLAALRLLPANLAQRAIDPADRPLPATFAHMFHDDLQLDVREPMRPELVGRVACRALFLSLAGPLAGGVRGWCGAAPAKQASVLRRLARHYVAPQLRRRQLDAVVARCSEGALRDARLTVHRARAEVSCSLVVDERRVELAVALADDHPLQLPTLSAPRAPAAPRAHWIAHYLAYQNGSLVNALQMWASAVTARVESAPQCFICYCRMHPATGRLPNVPCHQCRNKFHSQCLRKWFVSSNKSNCPLCRANF